MSSPKLHRRAPIALFAYCRLEHTRQTLDALAANRLADQSDLIVFSDGARNAGERAAVAAVRALIRSFSGFNSVRLVERQTNYGLARNIIEGVTQVCQDYGRVIVVEDDLHTAPYFLTYMNEALDHYALDSRVASIHGYCYPVETALPETFFLRGSDCWGWSTWQRAWQLFNPDGATLLRQLRKRKLTRQFDFNGAADYTKMLEAQTKGDNDSWAVRWYASAFLADMLTLYPGRSLVHNCGNDGSGTHCIPTANFDVQLVNTSLKVGGIAVQDSPVGRHAFERFLRTRKARSLQLKVLAKSWLPPAVTGLLNRYRPQKGVCFEGPFDSWEHAEANSSGYDAPGILQKVREAALMVKDGQAAYERDSVAFKKIEYSWAVLSALMWAAARDAGALRVLDLGGALGSTYFQHREFFSGLKEIQWGVVEQAHFVDTGKAEIEDQNIKFFHSIDACTKAIKPNVVLMGSVLQYLNPYLDWIEQIGRTDSDVVIIDRTIVNLGAADRVYVQHVPASIYSAAYPVQSISERAIVSHFYEQGFELIMDFEGESLAALTRIDSHLKGYLFKRRK